MGAAAAGQPLGAPASMRLLSDDRLARRATEGDQRAFEAIYQRYHQDLYRFCLAMLGNAQDAQDTLQNTMVKVLGALPGEKRQIKLKPWLYRIARNEAVETMRRRRDSVELEADEVHSSLEIGKAAEDRERLRVLLADLEQLPDRQRAALVMRELAGLDFDQIGEAFGSSGRVARQTLYEARLSLQQMEEGREMHCEKVMQALSDADGRVTRRRNVHAHLRSCASCRAFRDGIAKRQDEFASLAPLPIALSAGLLQGILSGQAGSAGAGAASLGSAGGAAGAAGAGGAASGGGAGFGGALGAGKVFATSAIVKSAATVAAVAVVGVSAADRSGVIDLPLPGGNGAASRPASEQGTTSSPARGGAVPGQATGTDGSARNPGQDGGHAAAKGSRRSTGTGKKTARSAHPGKSHRSASGPGKGKVNEHSSRGRSEAAREQGGTPAGKGKESAATHKPSRAASPGNGGEATAKPAPAPKPETAPAPPTSEVNPKAGGAAPAGGGSEPAETAVP